MSDELRALASVASAKEDERARAHAEALRAEEGARALVQDARDRVTDAEAILGAASDRGASAADRASSDAHRARLRETLAIAQQLLRTRETAHARALTALEASRGSLGAAHGEHRIVQGRIERADEQARASRVRREDDEADELSGRKRD